MSQNRPLTRTVFAVTLLFLLAAATAACGSSESGDDATSDSTSSTAGEQGGDETVTSGKPVKADAPPTEIPEDDPMNATPPREGAQRIRYQYGPIDVKPGQNNIAFSGPEVPKPEEDGWIVRISPTLQRADGSIPPVDVIHLHHGVWLNRSGRDATAPLPERIFAAGEEKTIAELPEGTGYEYHADDEWTINYMIHNLFPAGEDIWITYDIDFIPADSPAAEGIVAARPIWMDVQNGEVYPVFDVTKGSGADGLFTYPDDLPDAYGGGPNKAEWTVDRDGVIVGAGLHLHPGGLYGELYARRGAEEVTLFRSEAEYFEPAGAVSWDVAMTVTPPGWTAAVKAGDVLRINSTYDSERASWYESMGIMVLWMIDGSDGVDPFTTDVEVPGVTTHGHLPENDGHGGDETDLPDATVLPDGPSVTSMLIDAWVYEYGDTSEGATEIPTVPQGGSITFDNKDAPLDNGIWHTVTACKAPCNKSTGIAYPLADADIVFDSGQLGTGGVPTAERTTWSTPDDLPTGTYTYFCRVHPFMRGAFRVTPAG
jgi:plastocyanin